MACHLVAVLWHVALCSESKKPSALNAFLLILFYSSLWWRSTFAVKDMLLAVSLRRHSFGDRACRNEGFTLNLIVPLQIETWLPLTGLSVENEVWLRSVNTLPKCHSFSSSVCVPYFFCLDMTQRFSVCAPDLRNMTRIDLTTLARLMTKHQMKKKKRKVNEMAGGGRMSIHCVWWWHSPHKTYNQRREILGTISAGLLQGFRGAELPLMVKRRRACWIPVCKSGKAAEKPCLSLALSIPTGT